MRKNHELCLTENEKNLGKLRTETLINVLINEFFVWKVKHTHLNVEVITKEKLKCILKSQSKSCKVEKFHKCLFGGKYKKKMIRI